jgi:hypothetical protein
LDCLQVHHTITAQLPRVKQVLTFNSLLLITWFPSYGCYWYIVVYKGPKICISKSRPGFATAGRDQLLPANYQFSLRPSAANSSDFKTFLLVHQLPQLEDLSTAFIGIIHAEELHQVRGIEGADPGQVKLQRRQKPGIYVPRMQIPVPQSACCIQLSMYPAFKPFSATGIRTSISDIERT